MEFVRQTKCSLCGTTDFILLAKVKEYEYTQCKKCGLAFANPMPFMTLEELDILNESAWYSGCKSIKKFSWDDFNRYRNYGRQLNAFQKYKSSGKILDIGCGTGYYLLSAKRAGFEPYGIEVSKAANKYVKECLHIPVFNGRLEDTKLPSEYFDGVRIASVLEHLPAPVETLTEVNRIMKNGGILELGIPNPESFLNFLRNAYHRISLRYRKDKYSFELAPPGYLYSFPKKTTLLLLEKAGFKPIKIIVTGSGNKTYKPFVFQRNTKVVIENIIDIIGKALGKGSVLYLYARKAKS